jgi:hypothetical protein
MEPQRRCLGMSHLPPTGAHVDLGNIETGSLGLYFIHLPCQREEHPCSRVPNTHRGRCAYDTHLLIHGRMNSENK